MTSVAGLAEMLAALALLAVVAVRWRRGLVMALPFLALLNGLPIPFGGGAFRVDQLVACVLVVPLGASMLIGARRLRTDSTTWWLAAILALNIVATMRYSPARSYSLAQCANLASAFLIYPLMLNFLDTREELDAFLRRGLWSAIVGSGIGILAYLLAVSGVPVGGAEVSAGAAEFFTKPYGAYGTMVEPNILGGFAAAYLVLAVTLLLASTRHLVGSIRPRVLRWVTAFTAMALVLSFTRAAWIAAAVGLVWVGVFGAGTFGERVGVRRIVAPLAASAGVMAALLMLPGSAGTFFRFKLLNLLNLGSQTAALRLGMYAMALGQALEHPIIGWGTYTFAPLVAQGADFRQFDNWHNLWIGNYLLLALHDTGVIGLALWLGALASVLRRGLRVLRALTPIDPVAANTVFALAAAVAVLLIAFLSTSGLSLGYTWLLIGVLGAYCRMADTELLAPVAVSDPAEQPDGLAEASLPAGL